jgi:hypothetical protein
VKYALAVVNYSSGGGPTRLSVELQNFNLSGSRFNVTEVFNGTYVGMYGDSDKFVIHINPSSVWFAIATKM